MTEYDIQLQISSDAGDALSPSMPNWKSISEKVTSSPTFGKDDVFNIAHTTTKHRLEAARMYLSILRAGYTVEAIPSINFLIRSMADNIFFSLASALDSLSFEINQMYGFNIMLKKVQIDHHRQQGKEKNCVRCSLDAIGNDKLATYLNNELPREPIPPDHWYKTFSEYRHQVTHRLLYLIHVTAQGRYLPDDPFQTDPVVRPYYTRNLEVKDYCESCIQRVLSIVEKTYSYLVPKI
jgi:hypothetical protein